MGYSKLKRKKLRNRLKAQQKTVKIKELNAQPVIKNIDVAAIKEEFRAKKQGNTPAKKSDDTKEGGSAAEA